MPAGNGGQAPATHTLYAMLRDASLVTNRRFMNSLASEICT